MTLSKRSILILTALLTILPVFFSAGHLSASVVGTAVKTYSTPGEYPAGMTFDGKHIWLADNGVFKLYALDPATGKTVKTLDSPGYATGGLAWDGQLLWCMDVREGWIYGIDTKTGMAVRRLESYSPGVKGLAFDGEYLWMLDTRNNKILKINRRDGMMHENIDAPSKNVEGLTFDGTYLWTSDHIQNELYRVDPGTGHVVTVLTANGPYAQGVCWDGKTLWNSDFQEKKIYKLDLASKDFLTKKDGKVYEWRIAQEFRNYGPGEVKDLDLYMAVPSSLENQEIIGKLVYEPKPAGFVTDRWGQKFARFHYGTVKPGVVLKPEIKVKVKTYNVIRAIFPEQVGKLSDIPTDLNTYLTDGFKYDINNPVIKKAVEEAVGKEQHPYWIMRKIFQYIMSKLEYNLKPLGGWNPAPTVLERGTGSCSEYTFVFIAMCRAAGLPARYTGALVVRSEDRGFDKVWHRWAQVYLPGYGWIPVDVQAGDKRKPGRRAKCIGEISNRMLITTRGGGDSRYLDFYYNFNSNWKTKGKCRIHSTAYGEFTPLDTP